MRESLHKGRESHWWIEVKGAPPRKTGRQRLTIAEVRKRVSILGLLGHYFQEKGGRIPVVDTFDSPHDRDWIAVNCPFHHDTRPSASMNVRTGWFRCHGPCDFSGDVIDIVCWQEGLTVEEALDWFSEHWFIPTMP